MITRPELEYRQEFTTALLARAANAHPPGMDADTARRFRVYRNNVYVALIDALADAYPVVQRLVGEEFFSAMAREFFLTEKTREPTLALYGEGFAEFIEQFTPAASVAYLADIARLERARLESLHAVDAEVLDVSGLPGNGEEILQAQLEPHPALRLVGSSHPIVSIWLANLSDESEHIITDNAEHALITRPGFEVCTALLEQDAALFTNSLMQGCTVQQAYAKAVTVSADFDIGTSFSLLLEAGAFTRASIIQEN